MTTDIITIYEQSGVDGLHDHFHDLARSFGLPLEVSVVDHIVQGRPTGGFLTAVLSGDLYGSYSRADDRNRKAIPFYTEFMLLHAPAASFGNRPSVDQWRTSGGLVEFIKRAQGQSEEATRAEALTLLEPFGCGIEPIRECKVESLRRGLEGIGAGVWTAEEMAAAVLSEFVDE